MIIKALRILLNYLVIDEDDLQNKMKETFENLSSLFDMSGADLRKFTR